MRWTRAASARRRSQGGSNRERVRRANDRRPSHTANSRGPGARSWRQALWWCSEPTGLAVSAIRKATVATELVSPGRSRHKPFQPLRREGRVVSGPPVSPLCIRAHPFSTEAMGASRHPVFPAPSSLKEGREIEQSSGRMCRENAKLCLPLRRELQAPTSRRRPGFRRDDIAVALVMSATRSTPLTIFWRCSCGHFSSRNAARASRQRTFNGFDRGFIGSKGSGNADSRPKRWDFGGGGLGRRHRRDSGRAPAHPPPWRAPSYLPLRAGWAPRAWALRGLYEITGHLPALKAEGRESLKEI